jgi:hypothetical protein
VQSRLNYRRVVDVALFSVGEISDINREDSARARPQIARQQCGKDRVAVWAWKAHPHQATLTVDQRRNLAVTDNCEIQMMMLLSVHGATTV